jgi:DNA-binding NtrC family response regulator
LHPEVFDANPVPFDISKELKGHEMLKDRILLVEDEISVRDTICTFLQSRNYEVLSTDTCAGAEQLARVAHPDAAVLDYCLPDGNAIDLIPRLRALDPGLPLIVLTGYGSIDLAVEAVKLGAEHFLTKPTELGTLSLILQRCIENQRNRQKELVEKSQMHRRTLDPFLGSSPSIAALGETARKILASDSPILIQGETGTGKGVLAHWLHQHGPRASSPFVDLNCGGLSRELLETELFGHERGAFTGAVHAKTGLLEIAHKGTVFLDEIGDVDLQVQPKLLKVLEEKQFRRLGDVRDRRVDIRLIAATHQDMAKRVRERSFRSDLYFRISTIPLTTPPLRERVEDVPVLTASILGNLASDLGMGPIEISPGAMRMLQSYSWPGNIRELRNVLERAVLLNGSRILTERDLHFDVEVDSMNPRNGAVRTLEDMERQYIEEVLFLEGGKVEPTARKLGIPRSSLYHKIKQYGISRPNSSAMH